MRSFRPLSTATYRARRRPWRAIVVVALAAAGLTIAIIGLVWYIRLWSVGAAVGRALVLLQGARNAVEIDDAFAAWEAETSGRWRGREAAVLENVFANHEPAEPRVRAFLSCVAGADYGDRRVDWERWYVAWKRLRDGKPPAIKSDEAVRLDREWDAPIGLTAWHSTILPIDGQIYVASLGSDTNSADDPSDGLVRVHGATGAAELIFVPPDRGPRDILGLAAGDDSLFVACRNGTVYNVSPTGELRWKTFIGGPIASIPLAFDVNNDRTTDVIVVSQQEKVVALHGANGRTIWTAPGAAAARRSDPRGTFVSVSLAAGDLLPAAGEELLVAALAGSVRVLAIADGAQRWKGEVQSGCYGGALLPDPQNSPGRPGFVADGTGGIWSLLQAARSIDALLTWQLGSPATTAVVAAPRTIFSAKPGSGDPRGGSAPWLLACSAGSAGGAGGSIFALAGDVVRWRYTPGGVIWGTPAVADLNADREGEVVIGTMEAALPVAEGEPSPTGFARGGITILSRDGHYLRQIALNAPVECSPVVADVDGDGRLEVLAADRGGTLHCFGTKGFGPVEWGLYGGDSHNTRTAAHAYAWGQAPHGHQWRWKP